MISFELSAHLVVCSGDMKMAVAVPEYEELNEWLATNSTSYDHIDRYSKPFVNVSDFSLAIDFFNEISLLYGTISRFCTVENCPKMSAGPKYVDAHLLVTYHLTSRS